MTNASVSVPISHGKICILYLVYFLPHLVWALCSNSLGEKVSFSSPLSAALILSAPYFFASLVVVLLGSCRISLALLGLTTALLSIVSSVGLLHHQIYGHGLSPSTIYLLVNTNMSEAHNYLGLYATPRVLAPFILFLLVMTVLMLLLFRGHNVRPRKTTASWGAAAVFVAAAMATYNLHPIVNHRQLMFPQLLDAWRNYRYDEMMMQKMRQEGHRSPGPVEAVHAGERETAVLIIGESATRSHMSLYGYERETNPLLSRKDGLIVFRDAVSADFCTYLSLQKLLTFASFADMKPLYGPTLLDVAKAGGYTTFWISNQKSNGRGDLWSKYFSEAADIRLYLNTTDLTDPVDGVLLDPFRKAVAGPQQKKLIIVHLMGSHFDAINRYPQNFTKFPTTDGVDLFTKRASQEYINRYDNSIIYNDFIVASLLEALQKTPGANTFTYISDHGEDVADETGFVGRSYRMKPSKFEIPLILWLSPEYIKGRQHFATAIPDMAGRPFQGDRFIHFFMDIIGVWNRDFDPAKSVVNAAFKPGTRIVNDGFGHFVDYAEFKKSLSGTQSASPLTEGKKQEQRISRLHRRTSG